MKKLLFISILAPSLAFAQVQVGASFRVDLPVIVPPLVVVSPGIQVVPNVDAEVFFVDGFYWTRHDAVWYRSSNPRSGWVYMPRGVPPGLARIPPGQYRRWQGGPPPGRAAAFGGAARGAGPGPGPGFREERGAAFRGGERHEEHGHARGEERHEGGHGERRGHGHD